MASVLEKSTTIKHGKGYTSALVKKRMDVRQRSRGVEVLCSEK